ncbi:MAG TPA: DciA family protein, partial [Gammaproteobacteria bacterium]|nr:DciA family protein [Gammaproteobacteria bacterium]
RPKPLRGWLRRGTGTLVRIAEHSRALGRLQRRLQQALPASARGHWQLAAVDRETLSIVAASPAWASQLRFRQSALLAAVEQSAGIRPRRCHITVDPPRIGKRREDRAALSHKTTEHLRQFADSQEDGRLRESLRRLASRGDGGTGGD